MFMITVASTWDRFQAVKGNWGARKFSDELEVGEKINQLSSLRFKTSESIKLELSSYPSTVMLEWTISSLDILLFKKLNSAISKSRFLCIVAFVAYAITVFLLGKY